MAEVQLRKDVATASAIQASLSKGTAQSETDGALAQHVGELSAVSDAAAEAFVANMHHAGSLEDGSVTQSTSGPLNIEIDGSTTNNEDTLDTAGTGGSRYLSQESFTASILSHPIVQLLDLTICEACTFCGDETAVSVQLPCSSQHSGCFQCLSRQYAAALLDSALIPARCCKEHYPKELASLVLRKDGDLMKYYMLHDQATAVEKMFCPQCSFFINMDMGASSGTIECPACDKGLCLTCKDAAHGDEPCQSPEQKLDKDFLEIAVKSGWKACPQCHRFIELEIGCNHITCVCTHEFCFACSAAWMARFTNGACECPLFDDEQATAEGDRRVHAQANRAGRQLNAVERQNVYDRLRFEIDDGYECEHGTRYERQFSRCRTAGGYERECDECGHAIPLYAYECNEDGCIHRVCKVCHFHR